jgi:ribulose 1,5-bisphosphate synthetase/thiazole synthase
MSAIPNLPVAIDRTVEVAIDGHQDKEDLRDVAVDNLRPFEVVVIGAGFSGINCAIRIPQRLRNVSLTVFEKNSDIGGTWFENR